VTNPKHKTVRDYDGNYREQTAPTVTRLTKNTAITTNYSCRTRLSAHSTRVMFAIWLISLLWVIFIFERR
jgi:hypothetical protein